MTVLVNGGLNLSELDGWWAEAYTPEVGWALGDGQEHGDDPSWDAAEAEALYNLLEGELIPEFYRRDRNGIPTAWVARIRESMARLTPRFSANRSVREYADGVNGGSPVRLEMTRGQPLAGAAGGWLYSARVPAIRPASDYTARVIPQHSGVAVPLEDARISWQR